MSYQFPSSGGRSASVSSASASQSTQATPVKVSLESLAATYLLCPGTPLGRLWVLNPMAYKVLAPWEVPLVFSSFSARSLPRQESGGSAAAFGDGD